MKQVLFVGKFDVNFHNINDKLNQYFNVQVCVDNLVMIQGILKIKKPDVVLISMTGWDKEQSKILSELKYNYCETPVVCFGTEGEQKYFNEFLRLKQFSVLTAPVTNNEIIESVYNAMGLVFDIDNNMVSENDVEKKSILLVDDNAVQLRTLNKFLSGQFDVRMATSGMKALTMIGKRIPDIIFLDYEMPICDSKMTLQMIRELDEGKNIPVVFLTGVKDKEHIKAVLELRPAGYLLKPATKEKILEKISEILG